MVKTTGKDTSLETGLNVISNVPKELKFWNDKSVEFIVVLQLNPLNTLS